MAGICLSNFLPQSNIDLPYCLNKWNVQTEAQINTELPEKFLAFTMGSHPRIGCKWLSEFPPELYHKIFTPLIDTTDLWCGSPCKIADIEDRIYHWQHKYYTSQFKIQTWAQIIELQRVLNRRWKKGGVAFQVPPAEVLAQNINEKEWWNVVSWLGWSNMHVYDLSSLHNDLVAMVHANPALWMTRPPHAVYRLLQRLCIKYKGRRLENDEISVKYKFLARWEEWNYETAHTSVSFPQIHISNEQ